MPDPPVVAMLTTFNMDEYVAAALNSGAAGFLLKDTDPEQLPYLVRALSDGGVVLSSKVTRTVVDGFLAGGRRDAAAHIVEQLTGRERRVLVLIAEGLSKHRHRRPYASEHRHGEGPRQRPPRQT